jgi:hypothetical protein
METVPTISISISSDPFARFREASVYDTKVHDFYIISTTIRQGPISSDQGRE